MKKLLFYYSIILSTILFIGSIFFLPNLVNIILAVAFLPIVVFLWIKATNPGKVSTPQWSFRLLLIVGLISTLGIYTYFFSQKLFSNKEVGSEQKQTQVSLGDLQSAIEKLRTTEKSSDNQTLLSALDSIQSELQNLTEKQTQIFQILGVTDTASQSVTDSAALSDINPDEPLGFITVKTENLSVNAYTQPSATADFIDKLEFGESYPFFQSQGGWYKILLPDDVQAWVKAVNLKEL